MFFCVANGFIPSTKKESYDLFSVVDRATGEVLYGQDPELHGYEPLIREDRVWEYFVEGPVSVMNARHNLELYKARFDGFETIDGQKYSRFVKFLSSTWTTEPNYDAERELIITPITENQEVDELIGLFREEGGKVYIYVDGDEIESYNPETGHFETISLNNRHEQLLYDFTKEVGEEYTAYCNDLYFSREGFGRNISPCTVLKSSDARGSNDLQSEMEQYTPVRLMKRKIRIGHIFILITAT